jgi:predicted O-methyltransferase YrrM
MKMPENLRRLLSELEQWGQENDAHQIEHGRKMLNLEPDTAQLLSIFVQNGRHTRLLEVGTSNGYSTIWLAWAAQQTGGHVTSIEHDAAKQAMAAANLQRAGLNDMVTLCLGDATEVLRELTGPFDFVFLDADRRQYPAQLPLILSRLTPNALLLADNVHSHPQEIAPYLEAISAQGAFEHVVIGVGKGLSVALKRA